MRAAAVLTLCCVIWGTGLVMVKLSNVGISPVLNAGLRSVVAAAALLGIAWWRGVRLFERDRTLPAGVLLAAVFAIEFIGLYVGLQHTTVARGVLFLHAAPFVAAAGEHFLIPGHRLSGMRLIGLIAAFAGLALALSEGLAPSAGHSIWGDIGCLVGGVSWGLLTLIQKASRLRAAPPEKTMLYQLVLSAPLLLLASWWLGERGVSALTPTVVLAFLYTVFLTVVFGYTIWTWMIRTYSAASLHAFTFLTPIFGAIAGHLILAETLGPWTLAGLGLVAAGIYLVNRPGRA